ncbi:MAG: hypothetical protein IPH75_14625 [bacterium]|nr:hypothetical protein [bacterium]
MPKPARMLMILQLLSHRRVVSLETIKSVCKIPDRTAYRYLNAMSEANIPVYFDKVRGGYSLTAPIDMHLDDLSLQEIVLLVTSLRLVQDHVNSSYRAELNRLAEQLLARQPYSVDTVTGEKSDGDHPNQPIPDFSAELSLALAQAAIAEGKKLSVHLSVPDGEGRSVVMIEEPRLQFDRSWGVTGIGEEKPALARFEEIAQVKIE